MEVMFLATEISLVLVTENLVVIKYV